MARDDDQRPEGATNERSVKDTIAQTGSGLPDEAVGPGQDRPGDQKPDPELEERVRRNLGVQGEREGGQG